MRKYDRLISSDDIADTDFAERADQHLQFYIRIFHNRNQFVVVGSILIELRI